MTLLDFPERQFSILERQPNFPNEDLSDENAKHVEYYLHEKRDDRAYANFLRNSLRMLHVTGHQALQICGIEVDYSEKEYEAFCNGFAAFEYASLLVNPQLYNGTRAVANTQELLLSPREMADFDMANRRQAWMDIYPNVNGVIIDAGAHQDETMKQLQARSIGAQIACELQMTA